MVRAVVLALAASGLLSSMQSQPTQRPANAHPIHSTLTEIARDPSRGTLRATIRVYADDFGAAIARATRARLDSAGPTWEAVATHYAASVFGVRDGRSRALSLHSCGIRRAAGVIWVCLETDAVVATTEGLELRDAILCELYDDQVNVVQGVVDGGRRSLLFVHGDGYKMQR